MLEIGCGEGFFLRALPTGPWWRMGVEINGPPSVADDVDEFFRTMSEAREALLEEFPVDAVVLIHVIEHLDADALRELEQLVVELLAADGVLYIVTNGTAPIEVAIFKSAFKPSDTFILLFEGKGSKSGRFVPNAQTRNCR